MSLIAYSMSNLKVEQSHLRLCPAEFGQYAGMQIHHSLQAPVQVLHHCQGKHFFSCLIRIFLSALWSAALCASTEHLWEVSVFIFSQDPPWVVENCNYFIPLASSRLKKPGSFYLLSRGLASVCQHLFCTWGPKLGMPDISSWVTSREEKLDLAIFWYTLINSAFQIFNNYHPS